MRNRVLSFAAVLAVAASSLLSAAPASANQPVAAAVLVNNAVSIHLIATSPASAGVNPIYFGNLQRTNFVTVRVTNTSSVGGWLNYSITDDTSPAMTSNGAMWLGAGTTYTKGFKLTKSYGDLAFGGVVLVKLNATTKDLSTAKIAICAGNVPLCGN